MNDSLIFEFLETGVLRVLENDGKKETQVSSNQTAEDALRTLAQWLKDHDLFGDHYQDGDTIFSVRYFQGAVSGDADNE